MAEKKVLLTQAGYDELVAKLDNLISVKRLEVAARLNAAIALGDLSENAEYDAAKEEQAYLEAEIQNVKAKIDNAEIIQAETRDNKVHMGSTVVILDMELDVDQDEDMEKEATYLIVGSTEADPLNGKISNESPLGKAILEQEAGTVVEVAAPTGVIEYKIVEIINPEEQKQEA